MVNFSRMTLFKNSDIGINLATQERGVLILTLAPRTLSSSISLALILSLLTIATAATNPCQCGVNYSTRNGSQPPFHVPKPSSHLIVSKLSTNLYFKGMLKYRKVTRPGIEPRMFWIYTRCSNQLSYPAMKFSQLILYLCNCQPKDTYSARHIQCHSLHARSTLWPRHDQISQSGNHVTDYIIQFQQEKPTFMTTTTPSHCCGQVILQACKMSYVKL